MSTEENKALMRQFAEEVFNRGNEAFAREHQGPGYTIHRMDYGLADGGGTLDGHVTVEDQVAEGDKVATRWRFEGTVSGELKTPWGTVTADKRPIAVTWISIDRFENGKIVEAWVEEDFLGFVLQIGVLPDPSRPAE